MFADFPDDDQDDLDRMLDGQADDVRSSHLWGLARLLRSAAAPSHPDELRGENAALAAFRAARRDPPAAHRVRLGRSAAKVLAAVAVTVTMGSAGAMAAGLVPNPLIHSRTPMPRHISTRVSPTAGEGGDRLPSSSAAPTPPASALPGTSPADGRPVPSGSVGGVPLSSAELCTRYLMLDGSQRQQALREAHFTPLVSLAGDPGLVDGFCGRLLQTPSVPPSSPSPSPSSPSPSPSASPSPSPSQEPSPSPSQEASPSPGGPSPSPIRADSPSPTPTVSRAPAPGGHPPPKSADPVVRPSLSTSAQGDKSPSLQL